MHAELTDSQWAVIAPLLPTRKRRGRPRADDRTTLNGILHVLRSGCRWQDMPRRYGAPNTCWRRLAHWQRTAPGNASGGHSSAPWMPRGSWFGPRPSWTGASCPQKGGRSRRVDAEGQGHQMDGRGRRTWRPYRGPLGQCATGRDHPGPGDAGHGARPLAAGTSQDQAVSTGRRSGLRQPFLPPQPAPARDSSLHPAPTVAGTPTSRSSPAQLSGGVRLPLDRGTDLRLARQLPTLAGAA